jgi:hypothetical protein
LRPCEEYKGESHESQAVMGITFLGFARNDAFCAFYETIHFPFKPYFSRCSKFFPHNACFEEVAGQCLEGAALASRFFRPSWESPNWSSSSFNVTLVRPDSWDSWVCLFNNT